jgi:PPP family 3-phenylpropionic acid transporter
MSAAPRLALQYVLLFGATGVSLPFAGLWLRAQGFDGAEIGLLLAAPMLARLATGPAIAHWADRFRLRRTPIALMGLAAALGYGGAALADGFWLIGLGWFVGATAASALIPLIDVLSLRLARRGGFAFSVPRGCGSAAFVIANVVMGALLLRAPTDVIVLWVVAASLLIGLAAWLVLPPEPVDDPDLPADGPRFAGIRTLLKTPEYMLAIAAIGAVQAAHAFHYGFSALIWKGQGLSAATTGQLWAFSVVIEIGFMWWLEPWRRRIGVDARTMLLIGAVAAVVRWALMASAPPLWLLWPLQALHALSFAATYLAGVQLVERLSPPGGHTAGQTLNSVLSAGVLIGLATLASGPLYDRFGAGGYMAMAAMALVGVLTALRLKRV